MNSKEILEHLYQWAKAKDFNAPYGVLTGEHVNKKGRKYLSITFGRARTLDATVEIYNRNFMILRTNVHGSTVFNGLDTLEEALATL